MTARYFMNVAVEESLKIKTEQVAEQYGVPRGVIQRWALIWFLRKLEKDKVVKLEDIKL